MNWFMGSLIVLVIVTVITQTSVMLRTLKVLSSTERAVELGAAAIQSLVDQRLDTILQLLVNQNAEHIKLSKYNHDSVHDLRDAVHQVGMKVEAARLEMGQRIDGLVGDVHELLKRIWPGGQP